MIEKSEFFRILIPVFCSKGFVRKGLSLYLIGEECVVVVNFQRSQWDAQYYINIGINMRFLVQTEYPKAESCHIEYRLERFFPQHRELILKATSLEKCDATILNEFINLVGKSVIPLLKDSLHEKNLREMWTKGLLRREFFCYGFTF